jgi:hypothetical protein
MSWRQNIRRWLDAAWPEPVAAIEVIEQYKALGQLDHVLADIALRGGVYGRTTNPANPTLLAWNEGRRCLALELIELAKANPDKLQRLIETYAPKRSYDDE